MKRNYGYMIYMALGMLFAACSGSDTCQQDLTTSAHISIHQTVYNPETEQYDSRNFPVTITVSGISRDSIIYDHILTEKLELPLQKNNTLSSFCIVTEIKTSENETISVSDTIDIYHDNKQELVSLECGCATKSIITAVSQTVNRIDSIVIDNADVSYRNQENNLRIYLNR